MGEVAPKIKNLRILGKKSVSAKFKASILSSGGSSNVKPSLPSTLLLVFDAPFVPQIRYLNFFPINYTIVSILNENVLLCLSFRYIFLIKSSQ